MELISKSAPLASEGIRMGCPCQDIAYIAVVPRHTAKVSQWNENEAGGAHLLSPLFASQASMSRLCVRSSGSDPGGTWCRAAIGRLLN